MKKILIFLFLIIFGNFQIISNENNINSTYISHITVNDFSDEQYDYYLSKSINVYYNQEYYSTYYFKNLISSFALNSHGSCSYVGLSMLLSFYDTYWDDNIIETKYEENRILTSNNIPLSVNEVSPGISSEPISALETMTTEEHKLFVNQTKNIYFQSLLISLANVNGINNDSDYLGLDINRLLTLIDIYLSYSRNTTKFDIQPYLGTHVNGVGFVRTKLSIGLPVLINLTNPYTGKTHTVVAYDYNSESGEIYVHTGWKKNNTALTHVPLSILECNQITSAVALVPKGAHTHTDNFIYGNNNYCSCSYIYPQLIKVTENYRDTLPTFKWTSLYKEKWIDQSESNFEISITSYLGNKLYSYTTSENKYTLTKNADWNDLLKMEEDYIVDIDYKYLGDNTYYSNRNIEKSFSVPKSYSEIPHLEAEDFNVSEAYSTLELKNYEFDDLSFSISYSRVRYDSLKDKLLMSCVGGDNFSTMIINLDKPINRIDVQLAIDDASSQDLIDDNYMIQLLEYIPEAEDSNQRYVELINISDTYQIGVGASNIKTISIYLDEPKDYISLKTTYLGQGGSSLGEILIKGMAFYPYSESDILPLSGYELDYEPDKWNNEKYNNIYYYQESNCYSYALNMPFNPANDELEERDVGRFVVNDIESLYYNRSVELCEWYLTGDLNYLGLTCLKVGKYEICPIGTYKILYYGTGDNGYNDFHFYRQNSDGTWSHKGNGKKVTNYDESNELILIPDESDVDDKYQMKVGYFAISPYSDF